MSQKPSVENRTASISLRLPKELASRLQRVSQRTGRPKSDYMTQAISQHISEIEDMEMARIRIQEIKDKRSRTYQFTEVENELGLST